MKLAMMAKCGAFVAIAAGLMSVAHAQTTQGASSGAAGTSVNEIIVTATRREAVNVLQVPLAVDARAAGESERRGCVPNAAGFESRDLTEDGRGHSDLAPSDGDPDLRLEAEGRGEG